MKALITIAMLFALPAHACPVIIDTTGEKEAILERLSTATDFSTSQQALHEIWTYWQTAPDEKAQELLDEGLSRIRQADYETAKSVLSELVDYCPTYAEGHNQLAFAHFLKQEFDASEDSLRTTIALEPKHFGALSGMGLIAHQRGNIAAAKIWIKRAVDVHPFSNERVMLDLPEKTDEL